MAEKSLSPFWRAVWRGIRITVGLIIAGIGVKYGKSDLYLLLVPALPAVSKYLRAKFNLDLIVI